ncbi:MAG: cytochrome C oxidase subunit II [Actinobacteria bacterium]|nr:MAG: cytochrome C oxidase subunit II [Actinomycetota bacterium]
MSVTRAKALAALVLLAPVFFLTGCSKVSELGFPGGVTSVNNEALPLWQGAWIAGGVVGVITLILILWPAVFHRPKVGAPEFPKQTQYHVPIEIIYTIIPFIIVAVMFYYTAKKETVIIAKSTTAMHEISVNGFQWSWQFSYLDAGKDAVVTGTTAKPAVLVVPLGEPVRYTFTGNDVIHGFWVPAFMISIQNIPGVTNQLEFTAKKLGEYPGRCNMHCGRAHSQMRFTVKVVTPADYATYLESITGSQA